MSGFTYALDSACEDDPRRLDYERLTRRKPEEGTRLYREDGDWTALRLWMMEMR